MPGNASLKDKRQVLRSVMQRVRNRHAVAVAEVDAQDRWDMGVLGVAAVSGSRTQAEAVIQRVVSFVETLRPDADIALGDIDVEQF